MTLANGADADSTGRAASTEPEFYDSGDTAGQALTFFNNALQRSPSSTTRVTLNVGGVIANRNARASTEPEFYDSGDHITAARITPTPPTGFNGARVLRLG